MKQYKGYVYVIKNTINPKVYVGETLYPIAKRFKQHLTSAFCKTHHCYNCHFFKAIRKYGKDVFYIELIDSIIGDDREAVKKQIQDLEKYYIKEYDSFKSGYNSDTGGLGGRIMNDEVKKRMSDIKKNDPLTKVRLDKIRKTVSYPVKVYDYYTGEYLEECPSAKALAIKYNLDGSFVTKCCKHSDRTSYITINNRRCAVRYSTDEYIVNYKYTVTDDIGSFIDYCVDLQQAYAKYGSRPECIERCCKGKILSSGKKDGHKLIWSYYEERSY